MCKKRFWFFFFVNLSLFSFFRRLDTLDVEVAASGFTKEMQDDLLRMENEEDDDESESEEKEEQNEFEEMEKQNESEEKEEQIESMELNHRKKNRETEKLEPGSSADEYVSCDEDAENLSKTSHWKADKEIPFDQKSDVISYAPSYRSYSTASTIAPEVIKKQVKKGLMKKVRTEERKRLVAKGEASATTRSRRDNRATIKECDGIWGWRDD